MIFGQSHGLVKTTASVFDGTDLIHEGLASSIVAGFHVQMLHGNNKKKHRVVYRPISGRLVRTKMAGVDHLGPL